MISYFESGIWESVANLLLEWGENLSSRFKRYSLGLQPKTMDVVEYVDFEADRVIFFSSRPMMISTPLWAQSRSNDEQVKL